MGQAKNTKKKQTSGGSPSNYSEIYKKSAANATAPIVAADGGAAAAAAVAAPARTSDEVDWKGEYGYVVDDLKRLGIITALIAGAIIVVGFFV